MITTKTACKIDRLLMGNRFEFTIVGDDEQQMQEQLATAVAEVQRIERLLSTYRDDSETNLINRHAGLEPVRVSEETIGLIERSMRISRITQGAFDITYGSIDKRLWNFDQQMKALPDRRTAKRMCRLIDFNNIIIDKEAGTVLLRNRGMRIGFGGIGKGYAAERAKQLLVDMGVEDGIVNASGDLTVWGSQPDGRPWTVGIAHPDLAGKPFASMELRDSAVATSGNYEKFVIIGGRKYSHTIDPRTGLPVTGIKSVTIFSPNAEISDALATPVTIMGIRAGLNLVNQLRGVECVIIDDDNRLYHSDNIIFS